MNAYRALKEIIAPEEPLWVGQVTAHNADGSSTVQLPGGGIIRPRGQSVAIGARAFVQSGEVRAAAPALSSVTLVVY